MSCGLKVDVVRECEKGGNWVEGQTFNGLPLYNEVGQKYEIP